MAMDFPSSPTDGQASNGYTWSAAKGAWVGGPGTRYTQAEADAKFVDVAGDTMTGHLFLPTGPAAANAIRKDYVDSADALKADKTYVDTQDATKASTTYVNSQDALRVAKAGDTMTGSLKTSGEFQSTNVYGFRMVVANYGSVWYQDGANLYLMFTNSGDQYGGYNSLRPFYVSCSTGAVTIGSLNVATRPTWGGVTPWDSGNFNPAAYAPVGGVGGNWVVGSSTLSTDGNYYMPWAGDWLSNVLAGKAGVGGVGGDFTAGVSIRSNGLMYSLGSAGNTTTNASNVYINATGGNIHRSTSSADFKTALEPLEATFADKVLTLDTVFYRPTEDTVDRTDWSRYGFIAENCYAVDPRFSSCVEEATPTHHDINAIVAALLDVVRRQGDRIAALEAA